MSLTLETMAHRHSEQLLASIDQMPQIGDLVGQLSPADLVLRLEGLTTFLNQVLIPHLEAAERALYPGLERMFQSVHSMAPLRREHAEIRRATLEIGRLAEGAKSRPISAGQTLVLRRVIFQLYALLKVHLAEEQVYLNILDRRESTEMAEALAAAMSHPGSL
jgi:hypothetical protein